jgi:Xaa-Pro aminopeptidase
MPDFNGYLDLIENLSGEEFRFPHRVAPFAEFPIEEYRRRYARASRLMEAAGIDALLLTQEEDVRYFTGYLSILWCSKFRPYVGILPRDPSIGACLVLPRQELGNGNGTAWVPDLEIYPDQQNPVQAIVKALRDRGLGEGVIGSELGFGHRLGMSVEQFLELRESAKPGRIVDGVTLIQSVRMLKSAAEVARQQRACDISQTAVREGFEALREGMTEKELMQVVAAAMYRNGAEAGTRPSFFGVNAGPERYLTVNALPSDYAMRKGDLVMLDGGANYGGYATDFIRQASLGPPTDMQRRYYEMALEANNAAIAALRPGATGADVYEAGLGVFARHGVAEYSHLNIVGHGVGMDVHELPWLGERNVVYTADVRLRAGMVVCIEPVFGGVDDPDFRNGIFIQEDKVEITEGGGHILTSMLPKDLWVASI